MKLLLLAVSLFLLSAFSSAQVALRSVGLGQMQSGPYLGQSCMNVVVAGSSAIPAGGGTYYINVILNWEDAPGSPHSQTFESYMFFTPGTDELIQIPLFLIRNPMPPSEIKATVFFSFQNIGADNGSFIIPGPTGVGLWKATDLPATVQPSKLKRYGKSDRSSQYAFERFINHYKVAVKLTTGDGSPAKGQPISWTISSNCAVAGHNHSLPGTQISPTSWLWEKGSIPIGFEYRANKYIPKDFADLLNKHIMDLNAPGGWIPAPIIVMTDDSGVSEINITPSEIGCSETITASSGSIAPITFSWQVRVPGLVLVGNEPPRRYRYGSNTIHPNNVYSTSVTRTKIIAASTLFWTLQRDDTTVKNLYTTLAGLGYPFVNLSSGDGSISGSNPIKHLDGEIPIRTPSIQSATRGLPLYVNDCSLPWGGLFDVAGDYACEHGHGGHRDGLQVDIRTTHLLDNAKNFNGKFKSTNPLLDSQFEPHVRALNGRFAVLMEQALRESGLPVQDRESLHTNHWHCIQ